jgi:phosphoglucosamine mutase
MKRELFGTDGIRGVAGEYPLDAPTVHAVGVALGKWIAGRRSAAEVVIGNDTRESGPWLARLVAAGLSSAGVSSRYAGLTTTPGVAYLARTGPFAAGVMISASHNPYRDNGIKILDHSGFKLPDQQEHALEQDIFAAIGAAAPHHEQPLAVDTSLDDRYLDYLASTFPGRLDGMTLVLDAAHGSASFIGPKLFRRLGASVIEIAGEPNGKNINLHCGSLHLAYLQEHVMEQRADLGIAFDGDADRALFVSHSGKLVDGDAVMFLTGLALQQSGKLMARDGAPEIVATVMSNLGLEKALEKHGVALIRTPVGDKYVLEEMERRGARLGGEQSGHVIFRDYATTGDGLLTALRVLEVMRSTGQSLDDLTAGFVVYPQILVNVRVSRKKPLAELALTQEVIRAAERDMNGSGRVLVRFSGTEPLARVMVEGPEPAQVDRLANRIADVLKRELGG